MRIVTVVPCDHFEKHPPHISARSGGCSGLIIEKTRDPESSNGMNDAPQTAHGCSRSEGMCLTDRVTGMGRLYSSVLPGLTSAPEAR